MEPANGQIDIEKAIDALDPWAPTAYEDADFPVGPRISVGTLVVWNYLVTNNGQTPLTMVDVMDDGGFTPTVVTLPGGMIAGDANGNGFLDPGETWLYSSAGYTYEVVAGEYDNTATVTAVDTVSQATVSDSDINHHFGTPPDLAVDKSLVIVSTGQTFDADVPGIILPAGTEVRWTYTVTTTGAVALTVESVVDDNGTLADPSDDFAAVYVSGDTNGNGLLDPGEAWLYESGTDEHRGRRPRPRAAGARGHAAHLDLPGDQPRRRAAHDREHR